MTAIENRHPPKLILDSIPCNGDPNRRMIFYRQSSGPIEQLLLICRNGKWTFEDDDFGYGVFGPGEDPELMGPWRLNVAGSYQQPTGFKNEWQAEPWVPRRETEPEKASR